MMTSHGLLAVSYLLVLTLGYLTFMIHTGTPDTLHVCRACNGIFTAENGRVGSQGSPLSILHLPTRGGTLRRNKQLPDSRARGDWWSGRIDNATPINYQTVTISSGYNRATTDEKIPTGTFTYRPGYYPA